MWSPIWLLLLRLVWRREFGIRFNILAAHRRGRGIYWLCGRVWPERLPAAFSPFHECRFCFQGVLWCSRIPFFNAKSLMLSVLVFRIENEVVDTYELSTTWITAGQHYICPHNGATLGNTNGADDFSTVSLIYLAMIVELLILHKKPRYATTPNSHQ